MVCGGCDNGTVSDGDSTTAKDSETGEDGGRREGCGGVEGVEEEEEEEEKEEESRAPDGGWGWLVVLGSFITTMLLPLLGPGFGVIFSRYLLGAGSSSVTTAWIFNIHCFVWNVMGIVVRPLANEYGWRTVAMAGVVLASVALILSAFTPSPQFLFFSFSLLAGVGGGLVVCMSFIIVPLYFHRRRGLANALMMAGVCTGQMVGPPLIGWLQAEYGFQGATLVLSAVLLNGCVGAVFFHPVEWHLKPRPDHDAVSLTPKGTQTGDADGNDVVSRGKRHSNGWCKDETEWVSLVSQTRVGKETDLHYVSRGSLEIFPSGKTLSVASSDLSMKTGGLSTGGRGEGGLVRVLCSTLRDLTILRSPRALIISLGCMLFLNGYYNFIMMVPFAMQHADHSLEDSAWCISVSALCNMVGRTLMSALSDYRRFNMRVAYMAGLAATASSILVFPMVQAIVWLRVVMAVWGLGVGTTMGLYNLIMIRIMGVDNLAPVYGASSLANAFGFLSIGPLVGVIRDMTGSYAISMWFLSGLVSISFVLWLFMPAAQTHDQRRETRRQKEETSVLGA